MFPAARYTCQTISIDAPSQDPVKQKASSYTLLVASPEFSKENADFNEAENILSAEHAWFDCSGSKYVESQGPMWVCR